MRQEVDRMQMLNHPNILKVITSGFGEHKKRSGEIRNVNYVVTELVDGGDLFDYIAMPGAFSETVARYYTH